MKLSEREPAETSAEAESMDEKTRQTENALKLSIATGGVLLAVKLAAGFLTHSLAVLASALDSALDVGASAVNYVAAREAAKPPDEEHTYGHGKIESLASLFQSTFIGLSGLYLIGEAVRRLVLGAAIEAAPVGIGVMLFSMLASWALVRRLNAVARKSHSSILQTERLHFTMDILTNGGVILALIFVSLSGRVFWDLLVSVLISAYIFRTAYRILRRSIDELLDRSLPPVSKEEIESLIFEHNPAIVGLHNFRSRRVGDQIFLDFHIEIRGEDDFKRAHLMTESLISEIRKRYPGADVTVHFDPEGEM